MSVKKKILGLVLENRNLSNMPIEDTYAITLETTKQDINNYNDIKMFIEDVGLSISYIIICVDEDIYGTSLEIREAFSQFKFNIDYLLTLASTEENKSYFKTNVITFDESDISDINEIQKSILHKISISDVVINDPYIIERVNDDFNFIKGELEGNEMVNNDNDIIEDGNNNKEEVTNVKPEEITAIPENGSLPKTILSDKDVNAFIDILEANPDTFDRFMKLVNKYLYDNMVKDKQEKSNADFQSTTYPDSMVKLDKTEDDDSIIDEVESNPDNTIVNVENGIKGEESLGVTATSAIAYPAGPNGTGGVSVGLESAIGVNHYVNIDNLTPKPVNLQILEEIIQIVENNGLESESGIMSYCYENLANVNNDVREFISKYKISGILNEIDSDDLTKVLDKLNQFKLSDDESTSREMLLGLQ